MLVAERLRQSRKYQHEVGHQQQQELSSSSTSQQQQQQQQRQQRASQVFSRRTTAESPSAEAVVSAIAQAQRAEERALAWEQEAKQAADECSQWRASATTLAALLNQLGHGPADETDVPSAVPAPSPPPPSSTPPSQSSPTVARRRYSIERDEIVDQKKQSATAATPKLTRRSSASYPSGLWPRARALPRAMTWQRSRCRRRPRGTLWRAAPAMAAAASASASAGSPVVEARGADGTRRVGVGLRLSFGLRLGGWRRFEQPPGFD